jgi:hypothetical protein
MRRIARPLSVLLSLVVMVSPCMADIVTTEPERAGAPQAEAVKSKLQTIGVAPTESLSIVSSLSPDQLHYFATHDKAVAVAGQEDIVVMFWYEWIFAAVGIGLGVWAWTEFGEDAFFKD